MLKILVNITFGIQSKTSIDIMPKIIYRNLFYVLRCRFYSYSQASNTCYLKAFQGLARQSGNQVVFQGLARQSGNQVAFHGLSGNQVVF